MHAERNAAFLAQRYHPESFRYRPMERPREGAPLASWIDYFDNSWQKEGLPFNWYTLQNKNDKIGFSMKGQLRTLMDLADADQITRVRQRTKQDLLGFKLEYLSDHLIYPRKYTIAVDPYNSGESSNLRLEDKLYGTLSEYPGHSVDIVEAVSDDERGGTVKKTLEKMKQFFVSPDTPPGSIAIMTSPRGETGLTTDDGSPITYPDSYFFIMEKDSEGTVMNYTLKTDFSLEECREVVFALTGRVLPKDASVESFVTALATIRPGKHVHIHDVGDVVDVLQRIHPHNPWKEKDWESVRQDIKEGEQLYDFDTKTHQIIRDFEAFCRPGYATKMTYQKAIAATILRMSDSYYKEQEEELQYRYSRVLPLGVPVRVSRQGPVRTFGNILTEVSRKPGCAGGGSSAETTAVTTAGGERTGSIGGNNKEGFSCSECSFTAPGGVAVGDSCPKCGFTKADWEKKYGKEACG